VGKSTLFNALTKTRAAPAANYPFCTIDPNVGMVEVPDERLAKLTDLVKPEKTVPATVEFVDIAGLVKGASKGEGLGNAFLSHIREVHAICHVVRLFEGGDIIHVEGTVDPKRDRETIETELALSDLATINKRIDKLEPKARMGDKQGVLELSAAHKIKELLEQGKAASKAALAPEEEALALPFQLLTQKPVIYAVNASEEQVKGVTEAQARERLALPPDADVVTICAKIEEDLQELGEDEAREYLKELQMESSGLDRLIRAAYHALGYITFFTAGPKEAKAWTITRGMTAPQAAGTIHTDFQKGFIAAETIAYDDYVTLGGEQKAKAAGKMRAEGKGYVVKDGDVMLFRFNV
jgi:hypothetical protein